ncbi:MAG: hypothetical protein VX646_07205, partial [Verrucomicrobiota bacterium]|nr:hypothetical protein [Verrucomicrobiota bacterium]
MAFLKCFLCLSSPRNIGTDITILGIAKQFPDAFLIDERNFHCSGVFILCGFRLNRNFKNLR